MIRAPVLVIGCPRSGTTLLYNILSEAPSLWSIGYESKAIIERYHHPRTKNWDSGALDASDLTAASRAGMIDDFSKRAAPGTFWRRVNRGRAWLRDRRLWKHIRRIGQTDQVGSGTISALPQGGLGTLQAVVRLRNSIRSIGPDSSIRLLEKTPENCLRLPFLLALFPDARVIYLTRDARGNVNSLLEGWRQPHLFPGYQVPVELKIPGYTRDRWAFTLIPGWRDLASTSLEEISAWQWVRCNQAVLSHVEATTDRVPYLTLRYEDLITDTGSTLASVADFCGIDYERELGRLRGRLPQINVVSAPDQEKWRRMNPEAIASILPIMEPMMQRLGYETNS